MAICTSKLLELPYRSIFRKLHKINSVCNLVAFNLW